MMAKPCRASYAVTSAALPILKTLGLEEVDPEEIFELQRKEGAGAFGCVFRACYKNDRTRLAALKVIPVALEAGERGEDIESVRREIQFLRECDHPNVVAFHGAYYKDGALWVAMEHCAGGSVGDVRRARSLSEQEISVIMRGALCGLAYLHSRRKIHRDVKGGNILLTASGQVKIADFGVSAQLRDTLSRRGSFVGTPYWMSPELIQDNEYDFKADIWSLGITAIELADQKPPHYDEHPMRVLIKIPRNPPPQVAQPEKWSTLFLEFLRFCLRKDPAERPTALKCMQHEFIRSQSHVERVFANGKVVEFETNVATTVEEELDEELAEELGAEDESENLSEASGSFHSEAEDGATKVDVRLANMSNALHFNISTADELLNLSTSQSLILETDIPALSRIDKKCNDERTTFLELESASSTPSGFQPLTDLKLLPSRGNSPLIRSRDSSTCFVSMDSKSRTHSGKVRTKDSVRPLVSLYPKTSISPPVSPIGQPSWLSVSKDDPLASIDTVTSTRVNRLLSSLSTSSSSPNLAAALRSHNVHDAIETHSQRAMQRPSFNWRSVEAALPAGRASFRADSTRSGGKIFVGDPFRASHDVCVKYNSIQAQYEGAPMSAEWSAALHQQFGIALVFMRCRTTAFDQDEHVPALIQMLRRELVRYGGLRSTCVYRVSPPQEDVQRAKGAINYGSFAPAQVSDPHVYASLIKLWLRELPELLLDALDVQDLAAVTTLTGSGSVNDDDDLQLVTPTNIDLVDAQITRTLRKLGPRENAVLQWLLEHMLEVNAHRASNQMTLQALATVMAPNLFSCTGKTRAMQHDADALMKQVALFVRVLLSWRRKSSLALLHEQEETNATACAAKTPEGHTKSSILQQQIGESVGKLASEVAASPNAESDLMSLETALGNHVNRLWSEVETSNGTTIETKCPEHVLHRIFSEWQESTLGLIVRYSKRKVERNWANALLDQRKAGAQIKTTSLPSMEKMKDWVDAALSFEAFCRLLDREQTTETKIEQLQTRFGLSTRCRNEGTATKFTFSQNVFNHLSHLKDQQQNAQSTPCDGCNQTHDSDVSKCLLNGAARLIGKRSEAATLNHQSLAKLGERHPAIGNLLLLLGDSSQSGESSLV